MMGRVRQQVQHLVSAAWVARRPGDEELWARWRKHRWVTVRTGRATAWVLEGGHSDAAATNASAGTGTQCEACTRHLYTDGAWEGEQQNGEGQGGGPPPPAGYGVVEMVENNTTQNQRCDGHGEVTVPLSQITQGADNNGAKTASITWSTSGRVETCDEAPGHLGATAHTNNTGEMSALFYAINRAANRDSGNARDIIHTDSLYAKNMATGKWMPSKNHRNVPMIAKLRSEWRRAQAKRPGEIHLYHVRSHIKIPGNEIADWLADKGATGVNTTAEETKIWTRSWLTKQQQTQQHMEQPRDTHARPPGGPH